MKAIKNRRMMISGIIETEKDARRMLEAAVNVAED